MYPKNAWYVACTPDEIADKPLGRTICGEKIVFYRPAPDQVAALDDFCPHRGAPLSLGTVCEGHLQCGYHGLRVECTGKSVSMPGQRVQGFPKAKSFPVVERYGFIWVWPGDADKADPATYAGSLKTDPWSVTVDGLVDHPGTYSLAELIAYPWIFPVAQTALRAELEAVFFHEGLPLPPDRVECTSMLTLRTLLISTDVIAALPMFIAVDDRELRILPTPLSSIRRSVRVTVPKDRAPSIPASNTKFLTLPGPQRKPPRPWPIPPTACVDSPNLLYEPAHSMQGYQHPLKEHQQTMLIALYLINMHPHSIKHYQ